MSALPRKILKQKINELEAVITSIESMDLTNPWEKLFTEMSFYRNWRKLDPIKKSRLLNIARVDSSAIAIIIEQKHTKLSLSRIEKIAMIVIDEGDREKIKEHLITKSWKEARQDIDLILASYEDK